MSLPQNLCTPANPLPPPPVAVKERPRQPCAVGSADERMSHAHHSREPPVSYTKSSLCPSDDARDLVSFGAAEDEVDIDDDDNTMSTAASNSGDWSASLESEASHSEVREPPAPIDDELVKILAEAVQDLGLDWSPPSNQPRTGWTCGICSRAARLPPPQRPTPLFPFP